MFTIKRSGSKRYWHVMYNSVMIDCCDTKRQAHASLLVYVKIVRR